MNASSSVRELRVVEPCEDGHQRAAKRSPGGARTILRDELDRDVHVVLDRARAARNRLVNVDGHLACLFCKRALGPAVLGPRHKLRVARLDDEGHGHNRDLGVLRCAEVSGQRVNVAVLRVVVLAEEGKSVRGRELRRRGERLPLRREAGPLCVRVPGNDAKVIGGGLQRSRDVEDLGRRRGKAVCSKSA
jgi:hypothetical protein